MKQPTKKQRHKIYKSVLKTIDVPISNGFIDGGFGFCPHAAHILFETIHAWPKINQNLFPEYFLFKPNNDNNYWFDEISDDGKHSYIGHEVRKTALQLCIEMTR